MYRDLLSHALNVLFSLSLGLLLVVAGSQCSRVFSNLTHFAAFILLFCFSVCSRQPFHFFIRTKLCSKMCMKLMVGVVLRDSDWRMQYQ